MPGVILPPAWTAQGVAVRQRRADDLGFLRLLYRSTRWDEVTAAGMDPQLATLFLDSQFDLQCRHFDRHYAVGGRRFVVVSAAAPIGRIELWNGNAGSDIRIVDISLLPAWRGRGLGGALLRAVQTLAAAEGRSLSLHVDKFNRARSLYARLGFRQAGDTGASWRMAWRPGIAADAAAS